MFVFENHLFQPSPHPQNPRLTESSALNACYDWLPDGRSINYKNLDYEIETLRLASHNFVQLLDQL